ncbi:MAG TPA: peptidylprolyl isomerase [Gammaproteobacteria bacterium]|nr:peptidylprolyl isomerase [Gammaproteobacteria bacterium]
MTMRLNDKLTSVLFGLCLAGFALAEPAADKSPGNAPAKPAAEDTTNPANNWVQPTLQAEDMETLIKTLPIEQRDGVLNDPKVFESLVKQEAVNRALINAAHSNGLEKEPLIQKLMQRGADRVMAEVYLNRVIVSNLPAGYPTEAQIKEYFDKNKAKFQTPERMHLWQIFLPVPEGASDAAVAEVKKQAESIAKTIRQGKQDFSAAASQYSKDQRSRLNGGYLGLLQLNDLIPEVRTAAGALKAGGVSDPIRSKQGFHIIKKGDVVPAQSLQLSDINNGQIRQLMIQEKIAEVRMGALKKIQDTYPVKYDDTQLESWRQKIKSELETRPEAKTADTGKGDNSVKP